MTIKKLKDENEDLKMILIDVMWMAFRYVDGRSTYAPAMFNMAVHKLDSLGLSHLYAGDTAKIDVLLKTECLENGILS